MDKILFIYFCKYGVGPKLLKIERKKDLTNFWILSEQTLYRSIKGNAIDKAAIERVIISRCEVDMDEIQRVYTKKYGVQLGDSLCETIPSGDYRDFLVALATKTN